MCNFLGFRVSASNMLRLKHIEKQLGTLSALKELTNGFDYGDTTVMVKNGNDDVSLENMHWEFIPSWIYDSNALEESRKKGIPLLNATAEKILTSKMFRDAALHRRCLVPATHFFDWRHFAEPGIKKTTAYPYVVKHKKDPYFYMAGIWQTWTDKSTGEMINCFAIITTVANTLMSLVHNKKQRMPVILTEDLAYDWVLGDLSEQQIQEIATFQLSPDDMFAETISKDFKLAENPLEPFCYMELPPLEI